MLQKARRKQGEECYVSAHGEGGVVGSTDGGDPMREGGAQLPHALLERRGRRAPAVHLQTPEMEQFGQSTRIIPDNRTGGPFIAWHCPMCTKPLVGRKAHYCRLIWPLQ